MGVGLRVAAGLYPGPVRQHIPIDPEPPQEDHGISARLIQRRSCMSLQDRIESLRARHQSLELALQDEIHRPLPNEDLIHDIKRQKLKIKDEIQLLEHGH
jgi:hypothetical protein